MVHRSSSTLLLGVGLALASCVSLGCGSPDQGAPPGNGPDSGDTAPGAPDAGDAPPAPDSGDPDSGDALPMQGSGGAGGAPDSKPGDDAGPDGTSIGDPAMAINAAFDGQLAALQAAQPDDYGAGWAADLALAERAVGEARAAFALLSPAEQDEVARALAGPDDAPLLAFDDPPPDAEDLECASQLTGLSNDVAGGGRAAGAADEWRKVSLRKWLVARAFTLLSYIRAVLTKGKVGIICNMEQRFGVVEDPTPDGTSTPIQLTADRRSFIDDDALTSQVAAKYGAAKQGLRDLYARVASFFADDGDSVSEPDFSQEGKVVRHEIHVEGERVELTSETITGADGTKTPIQLVRDGAKLAIKAAGDLRRTIRSRLGFKVHRAGFQAQAVELEVTIQAACIEEGQVLPGCVSRVHLHPNRVELAVGGYATITATAYTEDNDVLPRLIRWSSSNEAVATITPIDNHKIGVRVLKLGAPVVITAVAGWGASAKTATAEVVVLGPIDCNGELGGTAVKDECGVCVGGLTGKTACHYALQLLQGYSPDYSTFTVEKTINEGDQLALYNYTLRHFGLTRDGRAVKVGRFALAADEVKFAQPPGMNDVTLDDYPIAIVDAENGITVTRKVKLMLSNAGYRAISGATLSYEAVRLTYSPDGTVVRRYSDGSGATMTTWQMLLVGYEQYVDCQDGPIRYKVMGAVNAPVAYGQSPSYAMILEGGGFRGNSFYGCPEQPRLE
jgi:hypothetical protein